MNKKTSTLALCVLLGASIAISVHASPAAQATTLDPSVDLPTLAETISTAAERGAHDPVEIAHTLGLPETGMGSLITNDSGELAATVTFTSPPTPTQIEDVSQLASIEQVQRFSPTVTVYVAPAQIEDLSEAPGTVSVVPSLSPSFGSLRETQVQTALEAPVRTDPIHAADACRAFPSDAISPLGVDLARDEFGVDGTGVTVGIISDSYYSGEAVGSTPDEDIAAGLLPGPGNPCGYDTPVTVLSDIESHIDEGRAMAQLIHSIAPGAKLMFHTGIMSEATMAEGIIALAESGATVIVDDIGFPAVPHYQQSLVSAAITHVQNMGVAYYSAAGNTNQVGTAGSSTGVPISAWQTSAFRPQVCPSWVQVPAGEISDWECLDFDPSDTTDPTDTLTFSSPSKPVITLSWAEPQYGVTQQMLAQLYVDQGGFPTLASQSMAPSDTDPVGITLLDAEHPGLLGDADLVVLRPIKPGTPTSTPALWIGIMQDARNLAAREHHTTTATDRIGVSTHGHPANGSAVGVAAANWRTPTVPEMFSSAGAGTLYFEPVQFGPHAQAVPAPAYPHPITTPGPQITGVDGNRTNFFGREIPGESGMFFLGTSAAAPNVAAVHALAAQYAPTLTAAEISQTIFSTASPMNNTLAPYFTDSEYFGAGLVNAHRLLQQLPVQAATGLHATELSPTSLTAEWHPTPGATSYLLEVLAGNRIVQHATLEAGTTSWTMRDLQPATTYTVRLTVTGAAGAGPAVTLDVTTPDRATPPGPEPGPEPEPTPVTGEPTTAAGNLARTGTDTGSTHMIVAVTGALGLLFGAAALRGTALRGRRLRQSRQK